MSGSRDDSNHPDSVFPRKGMSTIAETKVQRPEVHELQVIITFRLRVDHCVDRKLEVVVSALSDLASACGEAAKAS